MGPPFIKFPPIILTKMSKRNGLFYVLISTHNSGDTGWVYRIEFLCVIENVRKMAKYSSLYFDFIIRISLIRSSLFNSSKQQIIVFCFSIEQFGVFQIKPTISFLQKGFLTLAYDLPGVSMVSVWLCL